MDGPGSVTVWLERLKAGEERDEAVNRLWRRYFEELVRRAGHHIRGRRTADDGEDIALSAFEGFIRGVEGGKFPKLSNRDDLWQILLRMTANKANNAVRDEGVVKRGGGQLIHGLADGESSSGYTPVASDPDPGEVAALADETRRFFTALGTEELRQVAKMTLEGYTNAEIARTINKVESTVERKLGRIREIWAALENV